MKLIYCLYLTPVDNPLRGNLELYATYQDPLEAIQARDDKIKEARTQGYWEMWDVVVRTGNEDYHSMFRQDCTREIKDE